MIARRWGFFIIAWHHGTNFLRGLNDFTFLRNCGRFSFSSSWPALRNQRQGQKSLCCDLQRSLVVRWLSSLQPEWAVPSRSALILCRRSQLVGLERISLLRQESWNENQTGASLEFLFCLFPKVEVTHLNTYHEWLYLTTIRSWTTRLISGRATLLI